ncbi:MAG TPA: dTDP-4-dehydrorhamnose 3,5-epimerase [Gemmatimonadales bacterium]|nr:dTDP-4-dehydrorhamnose 3,5-epimerase [Gemmatimonadales bacterium]
MIFHETALPGAYVIEPERREDERGFFARVWCEREFAAHGLETRIAQCSISLTTRRGTLRGMHYQRPPHEEVKIVRCTRGGIHDVIIDLRPDSATFLQHFAVALTAENRGSLYVPRGFAHGFQTLEDDTEVSYQISAFYVPDAARGVRWDDPAFGIAWPIADPILLDRDRSYPDFRRPELVA